MVSHIQQATTETRDGDLRDALRWLMGTYLDHSDTISDDEPHIPNHYCEFDYAPERGVCRWHQCWVSAAELCGLLDEWAENDREAEPFLEHVNDHAELRRLHELGIGVRSEPLTKALRTHLGLYHDYDMGLGSDLQTETGDVLAVQHALEHERPGGGSA